MFGDILAYRQLVVYMNLLILNLDTFSHMAIHEKMLESSFERNFSYCAFLLHFLFLRNLVVALKELSIRGSFHSTGNVKPFFVFPFTNSFLLFCSGDSNPFIRDRCIY